MIKELSFEQLNNLYLLGDNIGENFRKLYDYDSLNEGVNHTYIYMDGKDLTGFIHIQDIVDEINIINIFIDSNQRRKGYASKLIDHIIKEYKGKKIILEVKDGNEPAINLYKKYGFVEINRRKGYYNGVDAILMEKK